MHRLAISYFLPIVAAVTVAFGYKKSNITGGMQVCDHQYALCTSALCIPQPGDPTKAICFCDVEEGKSMSTVSCEKIKPTTDSNGIRTLYSSFSQEQFKEGKKGMKCPDGTPWTWCLNKQCTVDPSNPKRALCVCDVLRKGEWVTLGGDCDTSTCETGYWSGASLKEFEEGNVFMTRVLGLENSPVKWCEVNDS